MFDNVPSIYIGINGTTDGNPLTTIKLVTAELEKLKRSFPPGLNAAIAYDSTEFIEASINEVIFTLAQAAVIVIIVECPLTNCILYLIEYIFVLITFIASEDANM